MKFNEFIPNYNFKMYYLPGRLKHSLERRSVLAENTANTGLFQVFLPFIQKSEKIVLTQENDFKILLALMGLLAPLLCMLDGSAPPQLTPSNISPNPSEVIFKVWGVKESLYL